MRQTNRRSEFLAVVVLSVVFALPLPAAPADLAGHWDGAVVLPTMKLEIALDFAKQPDGSWTGDITIPVQKIKDMALVHIKTGEATASFEMPGIPGNPTFQGSFSADGRKISGDFTQGGQKFAFEIMRGDDPATKAK